MSDVADITAPDGVTLHLAIDMEKMLDKEAEDPSYSVFRTIAGIGEYPRFTSFVELADLMGVDYLEFVGHGLTVEDLASAMQDCLKEVGFTPARQESSS